VSNSDHGLRPCVCPPSLQLLQKKGWKEGEGLGAEKQGIAAPVNMQANAADSAGSAHVVGHRIMSRMCHSAHVILSVYPQGVLDTEGFCMGPWQCSVE
jgi:hypothetical protein